MTITITIQTDNAAFEDYPEGEVARILQRVVLAVRGQALPDLHGKPLIDVNGNTVGQITITE